MGQQTIGGITATDISTHQLEQQNEELFVRLKEILTAQELSDLLLSALGIDENELSKIP